LKLIKKYKNRRIYDTETSKYITFDDIKQFVLDDVAFKVIDTVSEKDITSAILLQVIVEQEAKVNNSLSIDALRYLIKMSAHPMHETYSQVFDKAIEMMSEQMQSSPILENYQQLSEQWQQQMQSMMNNWQDLFKKK